MATMAVAEQKQVETEALITGAEAMAVACKLADVDTSEPDQEASASIAV